MKKFLIIQTIMMVAFYSLSAFAIAPPKKLTNYFECHFEMDNYNGCDKTLRIYFKRLSNNQWAGRSLVTGCLLSKSRWTKIEKFTSLESPSHVSFKAQDSDYSAQASHNLYDIEAMMPLEGNVSGKYPNSRVLCQYWFDEFNFEYDIKWLEGAARPLNELLKY